MCVTIGGVCAAELPSVLPHPKPHTMRLHCTAALAVVLLTAPGCATIIQGEHQSVPFNTEPSGAQVIVDGIEMGETPTVLSLERGEDYEIVLALDGHQDVTVRLDKDFDFVPTIVGNIFSWGLIGIAADVLTGAAYELEPEQITRTLEAQGMSVVPSDNPDQITIVLLPVEAVEAATGEKLGE